MSLSFACWSCGKSLNWSSSIGRRDQCPLCGVDLHSCKQCQHYDPRSYNECAEPSAERVKEKDRSNFCDFFSPRSNGTGGVSAAKSREELWAQAEALFGKKPGNK